MADGLEVIEMGCVRLNALLLCVNSSFDCLGEYIEFHVDFLALGLGDLVKVNNIDSVRKDDPVEVSRLKRLYKAGNVLEAREVVFDVLGGEIYLWGTKLKLIEDMALAERFSSFVLEEECSKNEAPLKRG